MRKPVLVGNWKMHFTIEAAARLSENIRIACDQFQDLDIGVAPPTTALFSVARSLKGSNLFVAAQNCHFEKSGAYTGEVSAEMIADLGCTHVILGHSERRQLFSETNQMINKKIITAHQAGLCPILCLGETLEQREAGNTMQVVGNQLVEGLHNLSDIQAATTIIAYEPIWAIGTGKTATVQQAEQVHEYLRVQIGQMYDQNVAARVRIQYGGSVKPGNISELMAQPNIDGALIGGASLQLESFLGILGYRCP